MAGLTDGHIKKLKCCWLRADNGWLGVLWLLDVAGKELTMAGWVLYDYQMLLAKC